MHNYGVHTIYFMDLVPTYPIKLNLITCTLHFFTSKNWPPSNTYLSTLNFLCFCAHPSNSINTALAVWTIIRLFLFPCLTFFRPQLMSHRFCIAFPYNPRQPHSLGPARACTVTLMAKVGPKNVSSKDLTFSLHDLVNLARFSPKDCNF